MKKNILSIALALTSITVSAQGIFNTQREAFDREAYAAELMQQNPEMQAARKAAAEGKKLAPSAKGHYDFTGYNSAAGGTTANGAYIPGMVDFNLTPSFECDTVAVLPTLSPYSCWAGDYFYSFQPQRNNTGVYNSQDILRYDPLTWERVDSVRTRLSNGQEGIPYLPSYDKKSGLLYTIVLGNPVSGGDTYDLKVYNPSTRKFQLVKVLCEYSNNKAIYDAVKGLFFDNDNLYTVIQSGYSSTNVNKLYKVDRATGDLTFIGEWSHDHAAYGNQAYWYSPEEDTYYYDHFNLYTGTTFYKFDPRKVGADGKIELVEVAAPNTGYMNVFVKPSAAARTPQPTDFKATMSDNNSKATLSFTVPEKKTDGSALADATIVLTVNDKEVSVTGKPGETVSTTVDCTNGINIATVRINDSYATGTTYVGNYDAPGLVGNALAEKQDDGSVKISWEAPAAGMYGDFASLYDKNDVTYTVVRNQDKRVIAQNITELSCVDTDMPEILDYYTYTITGTSHGLTGVGKPTNGVPCGKYVALPYENTFDKPQDLDLFNIWSDNGGTAYTTWQWNPYYYFAYSTGSTAGSDDWLCLPSFKASTEDVYCLSFEMQGSDRSFDITIGTEATTESQNKVIYTHEANGVEGIQNIYAYFTPEKDGIYRLAIHDKSLDRGDYLVIDNIKLDRSMSTLAPDSVRNIMYVNAEAGALNGTLFFDLPEVDAKGDKLSEITKYEVYVNNTLQKTITEAKPGSAEEVSITGRKGWNVVEIIAYNSNGNGLPNQAKIFVGPDVPKHVQSLVATWGASTPLFQNTTISWEAPVSGMNGGYVNPEALTYNIYSYDGSKATLIKSGVTETTYTHRSVLHAQDYLVFGVTAVNAEGESTVARRGITQGPAMALPLHESAYMGLHSNPWISYKAEGDGSWLIENEIYNNNVIAADGMEFYQRNETNEPQETALVTPILDFTNAENPVAKVWLYHDTNVAPESYFTIMASTDGNKHEYITEKIHYNDNAGWQQHIFSLASLKGKKATIGFDARLIDAESKCFIDSIDVCELSGKDIAIAGVAYEAGKVAGEVSNVTVSVTNFGTSEAKDYEVALYVNDEMLFDEMPEEALASTGSRTFTFPLALTAAMVDNPAAVRAEVIWDGDENAANNASAELAIKPLMVNLAAPSELTSKGAQLAWNAPEVKAGVVVNEGFENMRSFTIADFGDWKAVDLDGQFPTCFMNYYDNYWPNVNTPQAFILWDPASTGSSNVVAWQPNSGEKCLLCFESTGMDELNHPLKEGEINDDWMISPEVLGGTELSFWAKAPSCNMYGETTLEIMTSDTDRTPASFTKHETILVGEDHIDEWRQFSVKLPADAKFFAFRCVKSNFGLLIDDVTYTRALTPELKGYNVYNGSKLANASIVVNPSFYATMPGDYAVSAVYDLGESQLSNKVSLSEADGINEVILNNPTNVMFNVNGQRIAAPQRGINIINGKKLMVK